MSLQPQPDPQPVNAKNSAKEGDEVRFGIDALIREKVQREIRHVYPSLSDKLEGIFEERVKSIINGAWTQVERLLKDLTAESRRLEKAKIHDALQHGQIGQLFKEQSTLYDVERLAVIATQEVFTPHYKAVAFYRSSRAEEWSNSEIESDDTIPAQYEMTNWGWDHAGENPEDFMRALNYSVTYGINGVNKPMRVEAQSMINENQQSDPLYSWLADKDVLILPAHSGNMHLGVLLVVYPSNKDKQLTPTHIAQGVLVAHGMVEGMQLLRLMAEAERKRPPKLDE